MADAVIQRKRKIGRCIIVVMANPRAGILEMIALKPGDYRPPSWISEETGNYMSTSWNLPKMYTELGKIVDLFQSEGFFEEQIKTNINDRLDLDLKEDILGCLTGRVSLAQWVEPPARINSQVNGFGIELTDVKQAEDLIAHLLERINTDADEPRVIEAEHKGIKYWTTPTNDRQRDRIEALRESGELAVNIRMPEPGFAVINQTLVLSDSVAFIKHAIETSKGNHPPLRENAEFVVASAALFSLSAEGGEASAARLKLLQDQHPNLPVVHFALGNWYARQGRWADAQRSYFDAVRLDDANADYAFNLAVSLDRLNQGKAALGYYQKSITLADGAGATFNSADALARISSLSAANAR